MTPPTRTALLVVVLVILTVVLSLVPTQRSQRTAAPPEAGGARYRVIAADAEAAGVGVLPGDVRKAGLRFADDVSPYHRRAVADAIALARPEAQQLVAMVDGLVVLRVGPAGAGALGATTQHVDGYDIVVDLDGVMRRHGPRGVTRVVLHELAHVIDGAIAPDTLVDALDTKVPRGYNCVPGEPTGSCATREERFAETFAKWAMNDIGADLYVGYMVPPPSVTLDLWGRPLADLAAA